MATKDLRFLNGDEAVALGVKLSRPEVIAAYPITPQTIVVEKLSEYIDNNELDAEYIQVESEHSALAAVMGASGLGVRTFTATSSQGLLYMCEVLHYIPGSRFPVVMMNANRSLATPWSIYGDQSDSLAMLNAGWIQVYVENAQEALDMMIQAYKIAETKEVMLPVMVNLDGFILTHTYELVEVPCQEDVDCFLPFYQTENCMNFENPVNECITVGPDWHTEFRYQQHIATKKTAEIIENVDEEFAGLFGRKYHGLIESYYAEDADAVLITLGSVTSTVRDVVDIMRKEGKRVGLIKIRFVRPFPEEKLRSMLKSCSAVGVLEKDVSSGYEGIVYTEVCAALAKFYKVPLLKNFIAGLSGHDISENTIRDMFNTLLCCKSNENDLEFVDLRWRKCR